MPAPDLDIEKLGAAMAAGMRRRSPLMVWFIEHHTEFAALLQKHGADWKGLARHFADAGLLSRTGTPLTPRTVENYWHRAQRLIARQRTGQRRAASAPVSPPTAPVPKFAFAPRRGEDQGAPGLSAEAAPQPEPKFKPARMRNEGRGVSDAERRVLGDPTAPADPDA